MISAIRFAASRAVVRVVGARTMAPSLGYKAAALAVRQPTMYSVQKFSTNPPLFLDAAEVTDRIMSVVKKFDQIDATKVTPETKFATDLGLDSLDIVEVVMAIEDEFAIEIPDQEADKILSIADAVSYISTHPMAK